MILSFNYSVHHGPLQVKNSKNIRSASYSILHHNQLHWLLVLHPHRVDAVDAGQQAAVMLGYVGEVSLLDALESIEVVIGHRLDDETLILREEKERA